MTMLEEQHLHFSCPFSSPLLNTIS